MDSTFSWRLAFSGYLMDMTRPRKKSRLGVGAVVPDGPNAAARNYLLAAITV